MFTHSQAVQGVSKQKQIYKNVNFAQTVMKMIDFDTLNLSFDSKRLWGVVKNPTLVCCLISLINPGYNNQWGLV